MLEQPIASDPIKLYVVVDKILSTTTEPVNPIGFQLYVKAPLPVKVTVPGPHNTVGVADTDTDGAVFTLMVIVSVPMQPKPLSPSTVYVVASIGLTTTVVPVNAPGFHVYVDAPDAVIVALVPAQIVLDAAVNDNVGIALTFKFNVWVFVQVPTNPVTVYMVVLVGFTVIVLVVNPPGFHV